MKCKSSCGIRTFRLIERDRVCNPGDLEASDQPHLFITSVCMLEIHFCGFIEIPHCLFIVGKIPTEGEPILQIRGPRTYSLRKGGTGAQYGKRQTIRFAM